MKIYENEKVVKNIELEYQKNQSEEAFYSSMDKLISNDDLYIKIEHKDKAIYMSDVNIDFYNSELNKITDSLNALSASERSISKVLTDNETSQETWIYSSYMDAAHDTVLYVIAPLYPVASTVNILKSQLIYISFILLILTFVLVVYVSKKIANPITDITKDASKLGSGDYGITFKTDYSYSEINELADALNKTSYELERSSMLQRDLIANVSHDLRTPLTMVKSYAEMIRDLSGDNPEKRNMHLQVIIDEADRLNTLVNDILTLSDVQAGTLELHVEKFNIKDLAASVIQTYEVLKTNEGYKISFNCRQDIDVIGDSARIKQVINNLLSNAIKYCGSDKKIFINVKKWGKRAHIEIVDHGQGIKPDELPYIWERYYKSSTHHVRATKGSGIGLSMVKGILTAHNARFGVESKVGRGTTFWFELEVAPEIQQPPKPKDKKLIENRIRLHL